MSLRNVGSCMGLLGCRLYPTRHFTWATKMKEKFLSKHQYMLEEHNAVTFVIQAGV